MQVITAAWQMRIKTFWGANCCNNSLSTAIQHALGGQTLWRVRIDRRTVSSGECV